MRPPVICKAVGQKSSEAFIKLLNARAKQIKQLS